MTGIVVDQRLCVGAGHCARLVPDLFDQDPRTGVVVWLGGGGDVPGRDGLREVVALCPSGALRWEAAAPS
ncbi:(4Fe-4S)-binding protein [Solwaraspora sp. WMMA2065]|uniref:ferredoxin n=1 Tax=Solwaraspora sp. WMMA2065 TaxID=3015166 RepID=UPI00259BA9FD|nr:(4Fe-4S)-binding protein [Solwaraspora sp. WMMA2065]WJK36342.1 (4Fe-4S)-binding protein [Solwaraspora sp. WMMA2065]